MTTRLLLIVLGWFSVLLGIIGVFLPIFPTTPFILLAAWCFARSSEHFHQWLTNNRFFGPMIRDWEAGKGIPFLARIYAITMLWFSLIASMVIIGKLWSVFLLASIGIGVTIYLCRLPTSDR